MSIAPLPDEPKLTPDQVTEIRNTYCKEGPIPAIKLLRSITDWGLKESKDAVLEHLTTPADHACRRALEARPEPRYVRLTLEEAESALALINDMSRFVGTMALQNYARLNEVPIALARAILNAKPE